MGKRLLLFAGRIAEEKNIPFLLDIFPGIAARFPDTALVLAGSGPDFYKYQAEAEELQATVVFTNYLNRKTLSLLYAVSTLFVFPSLTETQGLVTIEAMLANVGEYKDRDAYLRECLKLLHSLEDMVAKILDIVRLENADLKIDIQDVSLPALIASILDEYEPQIKQKGLVIHNTLAVGTQTNIASDERLFRLALSNIILNAVQNSPQGSPVSIWTEPSDGVRLCVFNGGAQIDAAQKEKLFQPFFTNDAARSVSAGLRKTGLGLTIVRHALGRLGLEYGIENAYKDQVSGVIFWLQLPVPYATGKSK
jgi:signal transduction histidine kinase